MDILKLKETMTQEQLADHLGVSRAKVCHLLRKAKKSERIEYEDRREYTEEDVDKYIEAMRTMQKAYRKLDNKQVRATVRVNENKPFGVAYWGDWHDGNMGTDYDKLDEDTEKIKSTDGLYFIGAGDYKDNYISDAPKGGQFEQIIQPGMQDLSVERRMEAVAEKALALIRGCHEDWDKKSGDRDFIEHLCQLTNSINLWHGGELVIKAGSQEYLWRCRHRYKYQSSLNKPNAMRRIMEIQGPCDVAAEAHLHDPFVYDGHVMGEYRVLLRSGSYKLFDEYGQKLAGYKGKWGVPVIIMFPNEKRIIPFRDLDDGIRVLNSLRK